MCRAVEGIRYPFFAREVYASNEGVVETRVESIEDNVPLPEDLFERD